MAFKKEICRNYYLCDTPVENIFIDEYMPDAPGEYVKVFVYAYMYSGLNHVMTNELIAKRLDMSIEDVLAAWTYWESAGIIRKYFPNPADETHYDVEFVNIKNAINPTDSEAISEKGHTSDIQNALNDEAMVALYKEIESITGRMMDPSGALKIAELVEDGVDPSVVSYAYRYCKENNKSTDYKLVSAIVHKWLENGKRTVTDVQDFIENTDKRYAEYRQIMKALGLSFTALTDGEKRVFDSWMDEMGFSLAFILEVCGKAAGMNNKYSYVKKVLENEYDKQNNGPSQGSKRTTLNDRQNYYEQTRRENQLKTKERRTEVYENIPQIAALEEEIRTLGMEIGRVMLSKRDNSQEAIELIKKEIRKKQTQKEELLENAGFAPDYMEDIYTCYKCKDTGILDNGGHCSCFKISAD